MMTQVLQSGTKLKPKKKQAVAELGEHVEAGGRRRRAPKTTAAPTTAAPTRAPTAMPPVFATAADLAACEKLATALAEYY